MGQGRKKEITFQREIKFGGESGQLAAGPGPGHSPNDDEGGVPRALVIPQQVMPPPNWLLLLRSTVHSPNDINLTQWSAAVVPRDSTTAIWTSSRSKCIANRSGPLPALRQDAGDKEETDAMLAMFHCHIPLEEPEMPSCIVAKPSCAPKNAALASKFFHFPSLSQLHKVTSGHHWPSILSL